MQKLLKPLLIVLLAASPAFAGTNGGLLMLQASQKAVEGKFSEASQIYSSIIAQDPKYIDAYLQRAMVAREMGNVGQQTADAQVALGLVETKIAQTQTNNKNTAKLYYQRGTAYRLLKRFPEAKKDIGYALQLKKDASWQTDLQAISLEEMMR